MLHLTNVAKIYSGAGGEEITALAGVGITFRASDFCMVLGPSGCGKTTMLNIIGGLDKPSRGEIFFKGRPLSSFNDAEHDNYRNKSVGFIFQNYYLIPHITVLGNVELALALGGGKKETRREKAIAALKRVGLADKLHQKPNKLSGGQAQRVAIARALVNDPEIILADEPTGALDSETGRQIMELLKEISRGRLVIMVTHNAELAAAYGTRTVKMLDGRITEDVTHGEGASAPPPDEKGVSPERVKMSLFTALKLSFKNLLAKKFRTALTSAASAFGIAGVALVIALGSGMTAYVKHVERNTYAAYPLTISTTYTYQDYDQKKYEYPSGDIIVPYDSSQDPERTHKNNLDGVYESYLDGMNKEWVNSLRFSKSYNMRLMVKTAAGEYKGAGGIGWSELGDSEEFILSQYEMMGNSVYPSEITDVALVIDKYNRLSVSMLAAMGIDYTLGVNLNFTDLLGVQLRLVPNNAFFKQVQNGENIRYAFYGYTEEMFEASRELKVTAILRPRAKAAAAHLSAGIKYLPELQQSYYEEALESDVVKYQTAHPDTDYYDNSPISPADYTYNLSVLGAVYSINYVYIYATGYESREQIKAYLDAFNEGKDEAQKVYYNDSTTGAIEELNSFFYAVIFSLAAFAAIALLVSSVMISIIIYISVVERTNEIGLLRSLGARKTDVFRVFSAEAVIIGLIAGVLGVIAAYALLPLADVLAYSFLEIENLTRLTAPWALAMVGLSCALTFLAGMIPGFIAARKNPVNALKAE